MKSYLVIKIIFFAFFSLNSVFISAQDTLSAKKEVSPKTIMKDYLSILLGDNKFKKIKTLKLEYRINLEKTKIKITRYWKFPNKYTKTITGNDTVLIEKQILNSDEGLLVTPKKSGNIYGRKLNVLKDELNFIPEVKYLEDENYNLTLEGMEIMHGKLAYKIKVNLPNGLYRLEYYNSKNYLKARTVSQEIYQNDTLYVITDYGNYLELKEIENMIYPHRVTKTFNGKAYIYFLTSFKFNLKIKNKVFDIK